MAMAWKRRAGGKLPLLAIWIQAPLVRSSAQVSFTGVNWKPVVSVLPPKTMRRLPWASTTAAVFERGVGAVPVVVTWDHCWAVKSNDQTSLYAVYVPLDPARYRPPKRSARLLA